MKLPFETVVANLDEILDGLEQQEQRAWLKNILGWAATKCGSDLIEFRLVPASSATTAATGRPVVKSRWDDSAEREQPRKDFEAPTSLYSGGLMTILEIAAKYGVSKWAVKKHKSDLKFVGTRKQIPGRPSSLYSESSVKKLADKMGWVAKLTDAAQIQRLQTKLDSKKCKKKPHQ